MKKLLFALLMFAFIAQNSFAQDTTYFPHTVGNTWVYQYDDGRIQKDVITKDSIDKNNNLFLRINNGDPGFDLWTYMLSSQKDSVFYWPNRKKELIYRFPISGKGDKWTVRPPFDTVVISKPKIAVVKDKYQTTLFGIETSVIRISYYVTIIQDTLLLSGSWEKDQLIAKGFGLVWEGREEEYRNLIGCIIDRNKYGYIVGIDECKNIPPIELYLDQNYPNPFNPSTTISFNLPIYSKVDLKILDMLGREIETLVDDYMSPGKHYVRFETDNISSGVYLYRLTVEKSIITKKMLYLK